MASRIALATSRGRRPGGAVYNRWLPFVHGAEMRAPLELKNTLNLPRTDFPMKANLPQREPEMLERWEREQHYQDRKSVV